MSSLKTKPYTTWIQISLLYWTQTSSLPHWQNTFSIHRLRCKIILVLHTVFTAMPESFSSAASHLSCSCLPCLPVQAVRILVRAAVNSPLYLSSNWPLSESASVSVWCSVVFTERLDELSLIAHSDSPDIWGFSAGRFPLAVRAN